MRRTENGDEEPQRFEHVNRPGRDRDVLGRRGPRRSRCRARDSNSAIASVADDAQLERFAGKWAAMAITEPEAGSDSAAIRTTAELDGDEYVLNGEKIFVTAGERADLVVVWASLDRSKGRAAIKSFVVERSNPGLILERLDHKLGIKASDTATFRLENCRVPKGEPARESGDRHEEVVRRGDADVRQHRPLVAGMAVGVARACIERTRELLAEAGIEVDYDVPAHAQNAATPKPSPTSRRTTRRRTC